MVFLDVEGAHFLTINWDELAKMNQCFRSEYFSFTIIIIDITGASWDARPLFRNMDRNIRSMCPTHHNELVTVTQDPPSISAFGDIADHLLSSCNFLLMSFWGQRGGSWWRGWLKTSCCCSEGKHHFIFLLTHTQRLKKHRRPNAHTHIRS